MNVEFPTNFLSRICPIAVYWLNKKIKQLDDVQRIV